MVNFYNKFLSCNENATVHNAVGMYRTAHSLQCKLICDALARS